MRDAAGTLADDLSGRPRSVRLELLRVTAKPWLRLAGSLVLFEAAFLVAYWSGMSIGGIPGSPFWAPDTVLLCALLVTSPRRWWIYILAAAPIRFFTVPVSQPAWFLFAAFANDSLKAVIAAALLRRALPNPLRFDRLRDFGIYVAVAVFGVPMLSAVAGGATWVPLGKEFWPASRSWFLGDSLANLVLTPAVLYWVFGRRDRPRNRHARRPVEAILMALGLAGLGWVSLAGSPADPYDFLVRLYVPVGFLIWAAIRFGLKGTSAVLTLASLLAATEAAWGRGPLAQYPPELRILSIQLFLLVVALPVLFLAVLVRERDDSAAALRLSEQRYRDVVDAQAELICRYLPDTRLTFVNETFCRQLRCVREDVIGTRFLDLLPEAARPGARQPRVLLEESPQVVTDEHQVMRADGSVGWLQWTHSPVRDADGTVREFQATGRDVTERRRVDEANRKLAHAGRLTLLGELTASIAHEINQPLAAILFNADAAVRLIESGDHPEEVRAILADIRLDDLRASEVIRQVRSLVRRRQVDLRPLDLAELTRGFLRLAEPEARRKSVSIELRLDSSLPDVQGDPVSLQQVLLNLVLNGIEAMGGVPEIERRLTISVSRGEEAVEVAVADRGPGIPPSVLPRLFDSFVTGRDDGIGLGLSISRSIVEAHGGRIRAENNAGGGATVRFTLPAPGAGRAPASVEESS